MAALNQLAFPGAGTVLAGRKIGYAQATIMVAGFLLVMLFMVTFITGLFDLGNVNRTESDVRAYSLRYAWAGKTGLILSVAAWFWSLASSISMVRNSQKEPPFLS